jgi:hypothetical protein
VSLRGAKPSPFNIRLSPEECTALDAAGKAADRSSASYATSPGYGCASKASGAYRRALTKTQRDYRDATADVYAE